MKWSLYIIECANRLYTGISTDPARRLDEHRKGNSRGARFTRAFGAGRMVYCVQIGERSLALKAEARLKKLPRVRKLHIVAAALPREQLLECLGLDPS